MIKFIKSNKGLTFVEGLVALLLWKPLKSFQSSGNGRDDSSDMIGLKVPCTKPIGPDEKGSISYSGIDWPARLDAGQGKGIRVGGQCEIVAIEGNTMIVKQLD